MLVLKVSQMSTQELISLFAGTPDLVLSHRATKIIDELEKRGLIYDPRSRDFINCVQWNLRHGDYFPMDCAKWQQDEEA